jgi:hypothetical protein
MSSNGVPVPARIKAKCRASAKAVLRRPRTFSGAMMPSGGDSHQLADSGRHDDIPSP